MIHIKKDPIWKKVLQLFYREMKCLDEMQGILFVYALVFAGCVIFGNIKPLASNNDGYICFFKEQAIGLTTCSLMLR